MREIIFYDNVTLANKPVEEFLDSLDSAPRAKFVRTLETAAGPADGPGEVLEKAPRDRSVGSSRRIRGQYLSDPR